MATAQDWAAQAAKIANSGSKLSLAYSTNAINKYLSGGSLSSTQQAQVNKALKSLGAPPSASSSADTGFTPSAPVATPTATSALGSQYYIDPTAAYAPISQMLDQQKAAATLRNQQNAADIKTIFGTLATVRAEDRQRIQDQYATSLQQQQDALAGRTAETRAATAAGQQGAQTAAGELGTSGGTQPTPQSLTAQAAEQGIARSNEYQTTWNALQQVMNQQAQNDVLSSIRGYDYQQVASLDTLRKQLEDTLNNLSGQQLQNQSALAGAKLSAQQQAMQTELGIQGAQASAGQEAALAQLAAQSRVDAANAAAQARVQAAQIAANAKTTSAAAKSASGSSASITKKYAANLNGLQARLSDSGLNYNTLTSSIAESINRIKAATLRPTTGKGANQKPNPWYGKKLTASDYIAAWRADFSKGLSPYESYAIEYINKYM